MVAAAQACERGYLDARNSSLAAEWFGLLKFNPIAGLGFAAITAFLALAAMPLSWCVFAVF